jgi:exopolysaccharide biosynthesis polyprenyl glycosylphosphotransferase
MDTLNQKLKYIFSDYFASIFAWTIFSFFRQIYIINGYKTLYFTQKYWLAIAVLPFFWLFLHYVSGYYKDIYRKSRHSEFWHTFFVILIGCIVLFFLLVLDDYIPEYKYFYISFTALFAFHFILTYLPRLFITSLTHRKIRSGKIGFNTLIIGSNKNAYKYFLLLNEKPKLSGNNFVGFISVQKKIYKKLKKEIPHLGHLKDLINVIIKYKVEEIIIAIEHDEKDLLQKILIKLTYQDLRIKATPNVYEVITGLVKISSIYGIPLMELRKNLLPTWEETLKRGMDFIISLFALIFLLPVYIFVALGIVFTSRGPIFYSHERIGLHGKPFNIYKFRSMVVDAEKNGPKLSSNNDPRITKFGKFLRKTRLDEIPQFYNVLIGDMSLVGPRPERLFYIKQIAERNPLYYRIYKVRPGITSWSSIKIGYTETLEQMNKRLHYDLIYLENMSILLDIKILLHTVLTVLKGEGK